MTPQALLQYSMHLDYLGMHQQVENQTMVLFTHIKAEQVY
jgi:hypothetical protein